MVKVRNFSHVQVQVTDLERSRNFYEKILGLKPMPRPNFTTPGAWYRVGNGEIHLGTGERRDGLEVIGPHMAFDVEDFEAAKAELERMGVDFLERKARINGRQLWVKDPDGNAVELRTEK